MADRKGFDPKPAASQVLTNGRPLSADDAERGLVGALLADGSLIGVARELLPDPEDFASSLHASLYAALLRADDAGEPVDPPSMDGVLRASGVLGKGQKNYLYDLADLDPWPTAPAVEARAKAIAGMAARRRVVDLAAKMMVEAQDWDGPAEGLVELVESEALKVGGGHATGGAGGVAKASDVIGSYLADLREHKDGGGQDDTILTGWPSLDDRLTMSPGNLVIVGATPAMGKSVLVRNILAYSAIEQDVPAALLSMEMSKAEIAEAMVAQQAGVDLNDLKAARRNGLTIQQLDRIDYARSLVADAPFWIDDTGGQSIDTVRARVRRLVKDQGVRVVGIDYLQLVRGERSRNGSRENEVASVSRSLKALAADLGIVVIALSQINREAVKRPDKRPKMSDLRESGSLEQDANSILLLHREDYYHRDEPDYQPTGVAEVIIAKQRRGETGTVRLRFDGARQRFGDPAGAGNDPGLYG